MEYRFWMYFDFYRLRWAIYIGPMPSFRRGKPMWKSIIGDNIIVIDWFLSILASSSRMTVADFIGPYGEHALNPSDLTKKWHHLLKTYISNDQSCLDNPSVNKELSWAAYSIPDQTVFILIRCYTIFLIFLFKHKRRVSFNKTVSCWSFTCGRTA